MIDFETPRREVPTLNLSALIDITFILVIFIVLAATFSRVRVIDVTLPAADAPHETNEEALVITVPPEGPLRIGDRLVAPSDMASILPEYRSRHDAVLLVADRHAAIERAVTVMNDAAQAGFTSVAIATESRPSGDSVP